MATIALKPGLTWETLPEAKARPMIDQDKVLGRIVDLRQQWCEATGGDMTQVTINLELLFDDLIALCCSKQ